MIIKIFRKCLNFGKCRIIRIILSESTKLMTKNSQLFMTIFKNTLFLWCALTVDKDCDLDHTSM